MLALPLKLEGPQIFDANGVYVALLRGDMADYRERGAEIVATVNLRAEGAEIVNVLALENVKLAAQLRDARASRDQLLVAAKETLPLVVAKDFTNGRQYVTRLQAAITAAEAAP
jgi:hypothetical protein